MYPKASSAFLLKLQFYCEHFAIKLWSGGRRWILPEAAARPKCDFYVENNGFGFRGRKQSPRAMLNRGYRKRSPSHQALGGCGYKRGMPGSPRGAENRTWGSRTQPDVGPCEVALLFWPESDGSGAKRSWIHTGSANAGGQPCSNLRLLAPELLEYALITPPRCPCITAPSLNSLGFGVNCPEPFSSNTANK